jgi:hypothetical protein
MNLPYLPSQQGDEVNGNPFRNHISNEQFQFMLDNGFESDYLDCYADLTGNICFSKTMYDSNMWLVRCYITDHGIAVDYDYECGGNSSNVTYWFDDGTYEVEEFNWKTNKIEEVTHTKYAHTFEEAWVAMIETVQRYLS